MEIQRLVAFCALFFVILIITLQITVAADETTDDFSSDQKKEYAELMSQLAEAEASSDPNALDTFSDKLDTMAKTRGLVKSEPETIPEATTTTEAAATETAHTNDEDTKSDSADDNDDDDMGALLAILAKTKGDSTDDSASLAAIAALLANKGGNDDTKPTTTTTTATTKQGEQDSANRKTGDAKPVVQDIQKKHGGDGDAKKPTKKPTKKPAKQAEDDDLDDGDDEQSTHPADVCARKGNTEDVTECFKGIYNELLDKLHNEEDKKDVAMRKMKRKYKALKSKSVKYYHLAQKYHKMVREMIAKAKANAAKQSKSSDKPPKDTTKSQSKPADAKDTTKTDKLAKDTATKTDKPAKDTTQKADKPAKTEVESTKDQTEVKKDDKTTDGDKGDEEQINTQKKSQIIQGTDSSSGIVDAGQMSDPLFYVATLSVAAIVSGFILLCLLQKYTKKFQPGTLIQKYLMKKGGKRSKATAKPIVTMKSKQIV